MVAWCYFFLLVVIVLGWRERRRNFRKFTEINSRLAQVEELLLEVCSLVEERLIQEELPPLPDEPEEPGEQQEPAATEEEATEEPEEKAEPEKPQRPAELGRPDGPARREGGKQPEETRQPAPTAAGQREKPALSSERPERPARLEQPERPERPRQPEQPMPPEQPEFSVTQPLLLTQQESSRTMGRKGKAAKGQKLPPWNQQIIDLWQKGLSVQEIARQLEKGQGEVQLIIDLYCDERPQR